VHDPCQLEPYEQEQEQFGMIFMPGGYRRTRADTGRIITALEALLARFPGEEDLANGEAWL
jgi:hypothetical protein